MTGEAWRRHLQTYVALRRAIGFTMRPEARLLQDFVEHLERRGHGAPVAQVAVEWASASAESQHARRLSIVRGFLTMVRAAEPDVDVPGAGLVRTSKRPTPRILEPHEILALMEAARSLGPRDTLRPHTVATVIGLLASCGLRASEAIRLDVDHVDLADDLPCLQIQRTKFRKSRLVPLHPTTAAALRTYAQQRRALGYDGLCSAFFVSERGDKLNYHVLARTFVQLARRLGLRGPVGTRGVSLHKLRHSFAVARLAAWAGQGVAVRDRLPALAVYLGHVHPKDTYWYLTATPPVLEPAAARFEAFVDGKGAPLSSAPYQRVPPLGSRPEARGVRRPGPGAGPATVGPPANRGPTGQGPAVRGRRTFVSHRLRLAVSESDQLAVARGSLDGVVAGLLFVAGMRRSEVSALPLVPMSPTRPAGRGQPMSLPPARPRRGGSAGADSASARVSSTPGGTPVSMRCSRPNRRRTGPLRRRDP